MTVQQTNFCSAAENSISRSMSRFSSSCNQGGNKATEIHRSNKEHSVWSTNNTTNTLSTLTPTKLKFYETDKYDGEKCARKAVD